ncbi:glycosyltransferase [Clostridium sp. A1-XYC3]|uniref:Glycosyltransferase n=1 Tax=Clostridium tanneri TaxID=3037988 RepID=A0ABU4JNH1_9CLOT|nr:glycosyltransferase [Clostridium sp. A1-XYC3]MDW8799693.1 glycosyltransferase [Clostridium sp. A1-XYC3]
MRYIEPYIIKIKEKIQKLINEGITDEATKLILEYEEETKDDIEILSMKSVILIMKNELDEAETILKKALELDKSNPDILFNLGYIHEHRRQYKEAYNYYSQSKIKSQDIEFISNVDTIINKLEESSNLEIDNFSNKELKTSIVILTYNKLDYTKLCIDSVKKYTKAGTYEIIVVDNNSTDDTRDWLKEQNDIKVILNDINLGFPGGCNVGIEAAEKGNDILLLNNDTIVTPRWLENLNNCLYSDEYIGAVGAVSNSCSNYQAIKTEYKSIEEMVAFADEYNVSDSAKWEQKVKLIGFCMLVKRPVLDKVGLLDEIFFPGNFEDDDLGYRIQSEGYKLMLCNDTFVHHFGSTSFKDNPEKFNKLLNDNSIKFMNKWGFSSEENFSVNYDIIEKLDVNKSNINVLHIGCGTGSLLYKIKYIFKDAKLYAIDDNRYTTKVIHKLITLKETSIDDEFYYPENYFDYIIITNTLEKSEAPRSAVKKLLKFLKETGKVIVTIKNSNFYEELIKILMGSADFNSKRMYNYNEIKEIFSYKDFSNTTIESETINITSDNEMVLDYICKLTGEDMKSQYVTKEYLITLNKNSIDVKEIKLILRRIENSINIDENLKLLKNYLDKKNYEVINDIVMENIIKKEEVFNTIAIDMFNNQRQIDALKMLELSYKYNPNHKDTVYNISYIISQLGDKETAISYLDSFSNKYHDSDILKLKEEILGDTNER